MKKYELVIILHPDAEVELAKSKKKIDDILQNASAKTLQMDEWGKRKLAYSINKQNYGIYLFYLLEMPEESATTLPALFNVEEEILRYLLVVAPKIENIKTSSKKAEVASKQKPTNNKSTPKKKPVKTYAKDK